MRLLSVHIAVLVCFCHIIFVYVNQKILSKLKIFRHCWYLRYLFFPTLVVGVVWWWSLALDQARSAHRTGLTSLCDYISW